MTDPTAFEVSPETPLEDAVEQRQVVTPDHADLSTPSAIPVEANEADVMEQAMVVDLDEDSDVSTPSAIPVEANEADVMEQAMVVDLDEDYDR